MRTDPAHARIADSYATMGVSPEEFKTAADAVRTSPASFCAAYFETPDGHQIPGVCYQTDYRYEEEHGIGDLRKAFCGDKPRDFGMRKSAIGNVSVFADGNGMVLSVEPMERGTLDFGDVLLSAADARWGFSGRADYADDLSRREPGTRRLGEPYHLPSMAVLREQARALGVSPLPRRKDALAAAIRAAKGEADGVDCWPAWFSSGKQLVLRASAGMTGTALARLVDAAAAGRLGFGSASGPFHSGLFLYDTAHETRQLKRERTAAFDWHDKQMSKVAKLATALKAHQDFSVHFLGNPREGGWNDEDGTVRYWLNADWGYGSPMRRAIEAAGFTKYEVGLSGWWTIEQLTRLLAEPRLLLDFHLAERERVAPVVAALEAAGCRDIKIEPNDRAPDASGLATSYRLVAKRHGDYVLDDPRTDFQTLCRVADDVETAIAERAEQKAQREAESRAKRAETASA